LLVVIAILAILATVSIVGYNSFTKKARVSNDTVLVKQMNDVLIASQQTDGNNNTMTEALDDVLDGGYDLTKLTPTTTGYSIVWDSINDQMVLLDDTTNKNIIYPSEKSVSTKNNLFILTKSESEFNQTAEYSHYLCDEFASTDNQLTIKTGIDMGTNTNITSLKYDTSNESTKRQAIINTNSSNVTIEINAFVDSNNDGDEIKHYGSAGIINVTKCAMNSFNEYGKVGYVEVSKGHFVVSNNARIRAIVATSEAVKIDGDNNNVSLAYAKTEDIKNKHNGTLNLEYLYTDATISSVKAIATLCEEGLGTNDDPFIIGYSNFANVKELDDLLNADVDLSDSPIRYYKLKENVDFSKIKHKFTNQQCYIGVDKANFDLNGYTISNLDIPLVMYKSYFNIHNGKINLIDRGSISIIYSFGGSTQIDVSNIIISGNTSDRNGIIGPTFITNIDVNIENVISYVNINVDNNQSTCGLFNLNAPVSNYNISLKNCKVYGNITTTSNSASGMINNTTDKELDFSKIEIDNCTYYGTISVPKNGDAYYCAPGYVNDAKCSGGGKIIKG
ncbi:MAG: hypothetical protein SOU19_05805, partial [Candidatus Caccosoma sp.]|nr:hypothetical protein [Candidatus Caccosoma sp.]